MIRTSTRCRALLFGCAAAGSLLSTAVWPSFAATCQAAESSGPSGEVHGPLLAAPRLSTHEQLAFDGSRRPQERTPATDKAKQATRMASAPREEGDANQGKTGAPPAEAGRQDSEPDDEVSPLAVDPRDEPGSLEEQGSDTAGPDSPAAKQIEISREMLQLRSRLRICLAYYFQRPENAAARSPWGVMHALLPYGVDSELLVNGNRMNSIGYLCWNGTCKGLRLFDWQDDKLSVRVGPGYQGHEGQLLAMLAQSRVTRDYPIKVGGQTLSVQDLIEYEKGTCKDATELTFKLIGLSYYLDTDETWQNQQGQTWDFPRLIREELAQPVIGAACGGTHRMMGFAYAVRMREKAGRPMDEGQWLRAKQFVDEYQDYTFRLQNRDGSFSTRWFEGRGSEADIERRLQTTGHILEWLVFSLPYEELDRPEIVRSVNYLTNLMLQNRNRRWEIGPRGHALRALMLYDYRVFGGNMNNREDEFARLLRKNRIKVQTEQEPEELEARRRGFFNRTRQ